MRFVSDKIIDNPDLPFADPLMVFINENLLAGYAMLDNTDFSGNGNAFVWNGGFDSAGAILANDADHVISTPVLETDEMTIIWCGNLAAISGELCSLISSFDSPANANASGFRQYVSATGTGNLSAANGAGNLTSISSTFTGAWTVQTIRLGQAAIQRLTHAGGLTQAAIAGRTKSTVPIYINGRPASSGSVVKSGFTGTLAFMLLYKVLLDDATCIDMMNKIDDFVTARGVIVP